MPVKILQAFIEPSQNFKLAEGIFQVRTRSLKLTGFCTSTSRWWQLIRKNLNGLKTHI